MIFASIYLVLAFLLFVFQRAFIYFPSPAYDHSYETFTLENENYSNEIIVLNRGNDKAIIYFGGNAESVVGNASAFSQDFKTHTIYLVNYRGYGKSTGKPSEAALFSDALAVFDHVNTAHKNTAVMGRSLGSGVAMHVAASRPVSAAVLITPYDSILALAKKQYPMFPISWLLKDKYDSASLAKRVTAPVLIIAGEKDTLISLSHSEKLLRSFNDGIAHMVVINQAGHNDISLFDQFKSTITHFLN